MRMTHVDLPNWVEIANPDNPETRKELEDRRKELIEMLAEGGYTKKMYERADRNELKAIQKLLGI